MSAPTDNDWSAFQYEKLDDKAKVLYEYVVRGRGNMSEVAELALGVDGANVQRVSCITRCYGFEGNNRGAFKNIGATYEDVQSFVKAYPNGTDYDGKGAEMRQYLKNLVDKRNETKCGAPDPDDYEESENLGVDYMHMDTAQALACCVFVVITSWLGRLLTYNMFHREKLSFFTRILKGIFTVYNWFANVCLLLLIIYFALWLYVMLKKKKRKAVKEQKKQDADPLRTCDPDEAMEKRIKVLVMWLTADGSYTDADIAREAGLDAVELVKKIIVYHGIGLLYRGSYIRSVYLGREIQDALNRGETDLYDVCEKFRK